MVATPTPTPDVVVADLDGEIALLLPQTGDTLLLNRSAAQVWAACDGSRTLAAIVTDLREQFPDAPELPDQVEATVAELSRRGFLHWRQDPLDGRDITKEPHTP